jgi:ribosomal protein S18 acetylase RimI-like enzyme
MADPSHALDLVTAVPLDRKAVEQWASSDCGDTPAGRAAAEWIGGVGWPTAANELRRGTQIWAYENRAGERVGFASLRVDRWVVGHPPERLAIHYIPMLAVLARFQGLPDPRAGAPKYCYQILAHLRGEAVAGSAKAQLMGLSVRQDNAEATHIYQRVGFVHVDQGKLNRMLLRLP